MSYQALARKWRPKTFDQVIGQAHVVSALSNGLDNQRVHHAFLFTGTRGVGKTTLARIFAKALNCEQGIGSTPCGQCVPCRGVDQGNFIDLIEVDAASRTKVDDTRELLDNVQYTPSQGRFKIYLIDEVHMLSTHSFNALLKTLEEPPEHVKFLLATTDPQKLPATILSRCIQFNLKAMDIGRLTAQLEKILEAEGIDYDQPALLILARSANGSVRDALSLLDQGIAFGNGEVRTGQIRAMLGMIDEQFTGQLLTQVCLGQGGEALETVAAMAMRSVDFSAALDEILTALHNISLYQINPQAVEWKGIDSADLAPLAGQVDGELLQLIYQIALIGKRDLGLAPDPRSGFEMVLLRMIAFRPASRAGGEARLGQATGADAKKPAAKKIETKKTETKKDSRQAADSKAKTSTKKTSTKRAPAETSAEAIAESNVGREDSPTDKVADGGRAETAVTETAVAKTDDRTAPAAELNFTLAQLGDGDHWAACIEQSGLSGLVREMAMNMMPESVSDNTLRLRLDAGHGHLFNPGRVKKIEQQLAERLSLPLKLTVVVAEAGAATEETPSRQRARAGREKQQAAEQTFQHDPKVQELVDLFDAEIVSDSIRPPAT